MKVYVLMLLGLFVIGGCSQIQIQPNYENGLFNPSSSCTTSKGCYGILNHYNMGGQEPVLVHVYARNDSNVIYESVDGSRYSSFSVAVSDSVLNGGWREVNLFVPKCDDTVVYPKPPSNQLTSRIGYIVTGRTSSPSGGEFTVNDVVFGNGWNVVNQMSPGQFLALPVSEGYVTDLVWDPGTSTNAAMQLWCV